MTGPLLAASSHAEPEVRKALEALVALGWVLRKEGHWGGLYCPCKPTCTRIRVDGSPEVPHRHANRIKNEARRCPLPGDDPRRTFPTRLGVVN